MSAPCIFPKCRIVLIGGKNSRGKRHGILEEGYSTADLLSVEYRLRMRWTRRWDNIATLYFSGPNYMQWL